MDAEDFIDSTIANLKIVGMLQKNDKIRVHKGQISIDRGDGAVQAVRRWLNRDSRDVTLIHLRNTVNNAIRIARALAFAEGHGGKQRDPQQPGGAVRHGGDVRPLWASKPCGDMREWTLKRLVDEMQAAEIGLQNLRATYNADSSVIAAVDVLMDRLRINSEDMCKHTGSQQQRRAGSPFRWTQSPLPEAEEEDEARPPDPPSSCSTATSTPTLALSPTPAKAAGAGADSRARKQGYTAVARHVDA